MMPSLGPIVALAAMASLQQAADIEIHADPFDPFILARGYFESKLVESTPHVTDASYRIDCFRIKATGVADCYLKVDIEYFSPGTLPNFEVAGAAYAGGKPADFSIAATDEKRCMTSRSFGHQCKITTDLSVRLEPIHRTGQPFQIQFYTATRSWRGTVQVPANIVANVLAELPKK